MRLDLGQSRRIGPKSTSGPLGFSGSLYLSWPGIWGVCLGKEQQCDVTGVVTRRQCPKEGRVCGTWCLTGAGVTSLSRTVWADRVGVTALSWAVWADRVGVTVSSWAV